MDSLAIGKTIASLRKKHGMTQAELASKLNVSNKAVSKWESGQGFPDISIFPAISLVFGVSIDYLMMQRKGIAIVGNIVADVVKNIDSYPEIGKLANVNSVSVAVGGSVPNVGIDLAKLDHRIAVSAYGMVSTDENGRFILSNLTANGINVDGVKYSKDQPTSFTDVMSIPGGERTFFHVKGANSEFSPDDIDLKKLNCDILHAAYILLLDKFDEYDSEYGTRMARFLANVQREGIKTSIDMVSQNSGNYGEKVKPAMKYCNYFIVNEIECCEIYGLDPRHRDGKINVDNVKSAMKMCASDGVSDKVIVHAKEACFLYDVKTDEFLSVNSLKIPSEEIKGSVGAGDAFCAGSLYAIYNHYSNIQLLEFASASAACNLFAANSVDGMRSAEEVIKVAEKYGRLK